MGILLYECLVPPIVETLDNQVNWCGKKEWQANKLDAMKSVQKVGIVVEAGAVEVNATLDKVWVIFGLVDDNGADTETENQEDDKRKYWRVYSVLGKKIRMFSTKFVQLIYCQDFVNIFHNSFVVAKSSEPSKFRPFWC